LRLTRPLATLALSSLACTGVWAEDDIWTRATLLDTPGGTKQELKAIGVDMGLDVTNFLQALHNGGSGWANGGKVDLRVKLDGQKLGTWPGFFVTSHFEYNYGGSVNQDAPGLNVIAVNIALG